MLALPMLHVLVPGVKYWTLIAEPVMVSYVNKIPECQENANISNINFLFISAVELFIFLVNNYEINLN